MNKTAQVSAAMIAYYEGDVPRVNHLIKVYGFARTIGIMEGLDQTPLEILELAALTHDIGVKACEAKYQSTAPALQQTEGPPLAQTMLTDLGYQQDIVDRVCWLIAHHHEYEPIKDIDHQILIEAGYLVNYSEGNMPTDSIQRFQDKIFRTQTGKMFLQQLYGLH